MPRQALLHLFATICICSNVFVVSIVTFVSVWGSGKALRGKDGSMGKVVEGMNKERWLIFRCFGVGLCAAATAARRARVRARHGRRRPRLTARARARGRRLSLLFAVASSAWLLMYPEIAAVACSTWLLMQWEACLPPAPPEYLDLTSSGLAQLEPSPCL